MDALLRRQCLVFAVLFAGYTLYALCRKDFSFVIPQISRERVLRQQDMGAIVSLQNVALTCAKFALGVFSDSVPAAAMFTVGLAAAGGAVVLFAAAPAGLLCYGALWFANGIAQGAGWPAAAKLLRAWYSPSRLGTFWSLASGASNVAGFMGPIALAMLATDWRHFFYITGGTSILFAAFFFATVHNTPVEAGFDPVNVDDTPSKAQTSATDKGAHKHDGGEQLSGWSELAGSPLLWLLSANYLISYTCKTAIENWAQLLLADEKAMSPVASAAFMGAFESGGFVTCVFTGYITDWMMANHDITDKTAPNPRMAVSLFYTLATLALTHYVVAFESLLQPAAFVLGFVIYGNLNIFGLVATEAAPQHLSGSSHAVVALASQLGAVLAGWPLAAAASTIGWLGAFQLVEAALAISLAASIAAHLAKMPGIVCHTFRKAKVQ